MNFIFRPGVVAAYSFAAWLASYADAIEQGLRIAVLLVTLAAGIEAWRRNRRGKDGK